MLLSVSVVLLSICIVRGDPVGCTYYESDLEYECTARSWVLPLALSDFNHVPQSLSMIDVNGDLPTATFSGFDVINTTLFDVNFVPTFTIRCYTSGILMYHAGTFTGLGYFKEVHIQNCEVIAMPDAALQDFGDLNYFGLENGVIGDIGYDAFKGLNVHTMTVPRPLGTFKLTSKLDSRVIPNGVLYALANVTNFVIDGANVDTLQADMFQAATKLRHLSLKNNLFTSLHSSMISNMKGLLTLSLDGIEWECTCDNLWFLDYCRTNNISLHGPVICGSPSSYINKRAYLYKTEQCPVEVLAIDPCEDNLPGIGVGTTCLTYLDQAVYLLNALSLSLVIATVLITIHTKRQEEEKDELEMKPNVEEESFRKLSGSRRNTVSAISTVEAEAAQARQEDDIVDSLL
ncbi:uncharacterized protein LOC110459808 [Mizuhopecten yessoensis]|uniref:Slit-like 1 protein n=1 Tax=Mizuhopecten yessoensis TaxID=6573 RepID=A0A210Q3Y5_MIZYE|nr:uncharacterized protein LOC110459808 [Mizuhopecten yessoensis]OWF43389.1 Slit-like 1 protein [Mizuhopecten yessoensis]